MIKLGVYEDLHYRLSNKKFDYTCIVSVVPTDSVTKEPEKIIGTVELSIRHSCSWQGKKKYIYLANLAVREEYRRQGVGSKLLQQCEIVAHYWGFERIYLHVLAGNHQGQQLYLQNGYTIQQVETDLYSLFVHSKRRLLLTKSI